MNMLQVKFMSAKILLAASPPFLPAKMPAQNGK